MYNPMISSSSSLSPETCFMIGDSGYDDHKLYDLSTKRGFELVCPVQRYEHTPTDRLELIQFYESELGQAIYSWRSKSIEPLIEHIKSVFRIDPLPVRGYQKAAGIALLSDTYYIKSLSTTIIKPDVVNDQNQSNTCYVVNMLLNNI